MILIRRYLSRFTAGYSNRNYSESEQINNSNSVIIIVTDKLFRKKGREN